MIDPTELAKQEKDREKAEKAGHMGAAFGAGLLGGVLGGLIFLAVYIAFNIKCWPLLVFSGVGVYVVYLYFIDVSERVKKHIWPLTGALALAVILLLFGFILTFLVKSGAGISLKNVADSYFRNQYSVGGVVDYTLLWHVAALIFAELGFWAVWLYLRFAVPAWEKKNGATTDGTTGYTSRKKKDRNRTRVSGLK